MKIDVFAIAWNEERMISQFIDWYSFADSITIFDNYSTDKTAKIALERGCIVKQFGSSEQDNILMLQTKETCWKESTADWVIVCDIDEFIYHKDLPGFLSATSVDLIRTVGYNMISPSPDLNINIKEGVRDPMYDKTICFKPSVIKSMNWEPGCHTCWPESEYYFVESMNEVKLLHFNMVGREQMKERYQQYKNRMCSNDILNGYGIQYLSDAEEIEKNFDELYSKRETIW